MPGTTVHFKLLNLNLGVDSNWSMIYFLSLILIETIRSIRRQYNVSSQSLHHLVLVWVLLLRKGIFVSRDKVPTWYFKPCSFYTQNEKRNFASVDKTRICSLLASYKILRTSCNSVILYVRGKCYTNWKYLVQISKKKKNRNPHFPSRL